MNVNYFECFRLLEEVGIMLPFPWSQSRLLFCLTAFLTSLLALELNWFFEDQQSMALAKLILPWTYCSSINSNGPDSDLLRILRAGWIHMYQKGDLWTELPEYRRMNSITPFRSWVCAFHQLHGLSLHTQVSVNWVISLPLLIFNLLMTMSVSRTKF